MVVNILKDGTVVKDMSKITVPRNETTIRAYELIAKGGTKCRKENLTKEN